MFLSPSTYMASEKNTFLNKYAFIFKIYFHRETFQDFHELHTVQLLQEPLPLLVHKKKIVLLIHLLQMPFELQIFQTLFLFFGEDLSLM